MTKQSSWEKEFDEQFGGLEGDTIDKYDFMAIKSFISRKIQEIEEKYKDIHS